jgi:hypothetical protein
MRIRRGTWEKGRQTPSSPLSGWRVRLSSGLGGRFCNAGLTGPERGWAIDNGSAEAKSRGTDEGLPMWIQFGPRLPPSRPVDAYRRVTNEWE